MDTGIKKTYSSYPWFAIRDDYINSIINSNGLPLMLPSKPNLVDHYFKLIDGILITGGEFDIDPKLYGEKKGKNVVRVDKPRTDFEIKIARLALKKNKPILGICGGQQLLNVALNGSLIQHITKTTIKHEQTQPRNKVSHKVQVNLKSKLYEIVKKKEFKVNSALHQAINNHKFFLGIQWDPEFFISNYDKKIFKAFIKACQK